MKLQGNFRQYLIDVDVPDVIMEKLYGEFIQTSPYPGRIDTFMSEKLSEWILYGRLIAR